jgi:hypothetical protein
MRLFQPILCTAVSLLLLTTHVSRSIADPKGKLVVGFSQIGAESAWRTANTESIKDEAAKRGIDLKFADAQGKQENQIKAIRSFIAQQVDVIAFSPVVETGWEPVLKEAKDAGIRAYSPRSSVRISLKKVAGRVDGRSMRPAERPTSPSSKARPAPLQRSIAQRDLKRSSRRTRA